MNAFKMSGVTFLLTFHCIVFALKNQVCCASTVEGKLLNNIMKDYNKKARPVINETDVVHISMDIALPQLMKVDEKQEVITTNVWVRQFWNDPRFSWNKAEYGNISQIIINPEKAWLPDVVLLNSAEVMSDGRSTAARLVVKHDGNVSRLNPVIITSSCEIDITFFPLDDQTCELRFGSWSYSSEFLDVYPRRDGADLSSYVENGEWILLGVKSERRLLTYDCCDGEFPDVTYHVQIRRRTLFYMMNFILPCVLIAVLTLLVFLLPPESGERMSFGVTVLLSFTILLLMLMAKLPSTSKVTPLIAVYYACTIIEVSAAMGMACLMLRFYHPDNSSAPIPDWIRVCVLNYCARLVRLSTSAGRVRQAQIVQEWRQVRLRENRGKEQTNMTILTDNIFKKEEEDAMREEWRMAAMIINRLFAWIYLITIIITLAAVLLKSPRFRKGEL
ncbi:neuronal acetylcholine receptor subunit alpha-7-like [Stylophora pistillata]|uniref:neuronal acetylcholine receptor subunit alpha-7-like n=1 Tax=Stylophora pistillata TaxID=50429 RepID=UPI000C047463|nr:neuronal acetylcholine receptor subunit alpha-7-like [Stylophora pistillata]